MKRSRGGPRPRPVPLAGPAPAVAAPSCSPAPAPQPSSPAGSRVIGCDSSSPPQLSGVTAH